MVVTQTFLLRICVSLCFDILVFCHLWGLNADLAEDVGR